MRKLRVATSYMFPLKLFNSDSSSHRVGNGSTFSMEIRNSINNEDTLIVSKRVRNSHFDKRIDFAREISSKTSIDAVEFFLRN